MILALLACAPPDAIRGTLVDARTEAPIAGVTVRAEAEGEDCLRVSSATEEDGSFVVEKPCAATYTFTPVDPTWWLPEAVTARSGEVKLAAWRAPESGGIWAIRGGELGPLPTNTALGELAVGATPVRYPLVIPAELPTLPADAALILSGTDLASWAVAPLLPSPAVVTSTPEGPARFDPWQTLGATLAADGTSTPSTVEVAEHTVTGNDRSIRYLEVGKLPAGRYGLAATASTRALIFAVGEVAANP